MLKVVDALHTVQYDNPHSFFHFVLLYFFPNECPGLFRHSPGHSLGEKIKLHEMKNEKNYVGIHISKIWQILKHFSGGIKS